METAGLFAASADERGEFTVALPAGSPAVVVVSLAGFLTKTIEVVPGPGVGIDVVLDVAGVSDRVRIGDAA